MKVNFKRRSHLMAILLCLFYLPLHSQKSPIKYGNVDIADLQMQAYPSDTGAVAAILCDYGHFSSVTYDFVRTLRIKIFKKEGLSWGDMKFPTDEKTSIRGITYNLENGKIVETKLKSESIKVVRIAEDWYETRIAMPNIKEGSIIDIEFTDHYTLPFVWKFQQTIPVRWSELVIDDTRYIDFRKNLYGFEPLDVSEFNRWVAKDVPAFKDEPFMNNRTNYMTKFEIELLSVSIPPSSSSSGFFREYSTTWEAVNTRLLNNNYFGMVLQGGAFLNSIAKDIEARHQDPMAKLIAAHEAIKNEVKWDEIEALMISEEDLYTPHKNHIGNSADINLMLVLLLKKLDFKVYPVVLSTRDNGFLSPVYPSLRKLNYVVAYVMIGDKGYFLDATDEYLPVGMLPERCINLEGRIVDEANADWVDLIPNQKDKRTVQFDLTLGSDLILSGTLANAYVDYAALDFRNLYSSYNSQEEYLQDLEAANPGLSILDAGIKGIDSLYKSVEENYQVKLRNKVTKAGDLIYVYPLLTEQVIENPFKSEERKYPVDFIMQKELNLIVTINLPEGSQVMELPKPAILKLPDKSISMTYQVSNMNNAIYLTYKFAINKPYFNVEEYADLRALFSEVIKKHNEPVVIKTVVQ